MTVSSAIATATLNWTGVETQFAPGFQAENPGDVSVVFTSGTTVTTLTYNTAYSVTLDAAGNVTVYPIALPPAPGTLTISRNSSPLQQDGFQDGVPWSPTVLMYALDLCALRDQELRRDVNGEIARAIAAEATLLAQIAPLASIVQSALALYLTGQTTALTTVEPTGAGAFWNNNGVVCVTPGGANPLPTALPPVAGEYWNNGGVVCIS